MDQEELPPKPIMEQDDLPPQMTVAPPVEGPVAKYMREYRLLNSLLVSLFILVGSFAALWNIVVYVAAAGEGNSDFSDAGAAPARPSADGSALHELACLREWRGGGRESGQRELRCA